MLCELGILHRDISLNNLLLLDSSGELERRTGLLIDFDYSAFIQNVNGEFLATPESDQAQSSGSSGHSGKHERTVFFFFFDAFDAR